MKKYIYPITSVLALVVITSVYAFSSDSVETQIGMSREYQQDLNKQNVELREEAKLLQERLDKINKRIQVNKQLWHQEQGKIDILNGTFQ